MELSAEALGLIPSTAKSGRAEDSAPGAGVGYKRGHRQKPPHSAWHTVNLRCCCSSLVFPPLIRNRRCHAARITEETLRSLTRPLTTYRRTACPSSMPNRIWTKLLFPSSESGSETPKGIQSLGHMIKKQFLGCGTNSYFLISWRKGWNLPQICKNSALSSFWIFTISIYDNYITM